MLPAVCRKMIRDYGDQRGHGAFVLSRWTWGKRILDIFTSDVREVGDFFSDFFSDFIIIS